jgi:hypothetical protein
MSKLQEMLEKARREGIPRAPRPEPPKKAEVVIPFPQGHDLAVKKAERTRALEREKAAEQERLRRIEAYMNSPVYQAAGERFNRDLERDRDTVRFDPTRPHGFW